MGRILTVLVAAGLALVGPTGRVGRGNEFPTAFCPECWQFRPGTGSMDPLGQCRTCGKVPVEVEARIIPWYWCAHHRFWHRMPCEESKREKCLTLRESPALVVDANRESLLRLRYCPECRMFPALRGAGYSVCPACRKPTLTVDAVHQTWFWCKHDLQWMEEPCPQDGHEQCCSERTGTLPVYLRRQETGASQER